MEKYFNSMSRKLLKFLIMFDNSNLLFFPGQFLSGRVIIEVEDDMPVKGRNSNINLSRTGCLQDKSKLLLVQQLRFV